MRLCLPGSFLRSIPKAMLLSGLLCAGISGVSSQVVLIDPATDGGFETGPAFADNGWVDVGPAATTRRWYAGTGQAGFTGARCAFIGNNPTTVGNNNSARVVHLYKTITFPLGATNIQLAFDYKQAISDFAGGDYYDYIQVALDVATPTDGNVPGAPAMFGPFPDVDLPAFTTQNVTIPDAFATGTPINLIFTFISDNANPRGYGAIDNVSLVYDAPPHVDIRPLVLVSPLPGDCYSSNETVSIRVRNVGGDPIDFSVDPMIINAGVTGTNPTTFAPVTVNTGTLAVGATQDVVITSAYNMNAGGTYTFSATTNTSNDGNNNNDTLQPVSVTNIYVSTATASDTVVCSGENVDLFSAADAFSVALIAEDFNGAAADWTTINLSVGGDDFTAAEWTLRPDGYYTDGFWGENLNSNDFSQFYLTNSDEQGEDGITSTILQSPSFSTMGMDSVHLEFYQYFLYNSELDTCYVEASVDGIVWDVVQMYDTDQGFYDAFLQTNLDLGAYVNNPAVFVRFRFASEWGFGWAIDNVTVTGVSSDYTYNWTSVPAGFTSTSQNPTGVPVNTSTTYQVVATATATGCTTTATVTVNTNPAPVATTVVTDVSCNGDDDGEIDLTLTGGTPVFTYSWSNSATTEDLAGLAPGTYTVTITDGNSCTSTASAVVIEPAVLNITSVVTDESMGNDGAINITVTGGTGAYSYVWSNGPTTEDISGLTDGIYTVTVTDANGCTESATVTVATTLGVNNEENVSLNFYPNPSTGIINISVKNMQTNDMLIQVMDMSGKAIVTKRVLPTSADYIEQIDMTNAAGGTYLVRISSDAGIYNGRVIITR